MAERDVRYIPGIASVVSRVCCRSANPLLKQKCLNLMNKASSNDKILPKKSVAKHHVGFISAVEEQEKERDDIDLDELLLANTFESQLRLALTNPKGYKKQRDTIDKDDEQDYIDFDSDDESKSGTNILQSPINKAGPLSIFSSSHGSLPLRMQSASSSSSRGVALPSRGVSGGVSPPPVKEVIIKLGSDSVMMNGSEEEFDDI